jgi:hypothetical protein
MNQSIWQVLKSGHTILVVATTSVLLIEDHIDENRRPYECQLIFSGSIIRENEMVGITLSAAEI